MENEIIDDSFGITLNDQMRGFIQEIAKWSYFLSIVGFVMLGFMVLAGLFAGTMVATVSQGMGLPVGAGVFTITYLAMALLYFFPILYLFRFSSKAKVALRSGSDTELTDAFENLKSHYKFIGILTIVVLGLYALFFVFGGIGALMMG